MDEVFILRREIVGEVLLPFSCVEKMWKSGLSYLRVQKVFPKDIYDFTPECQVEFSTYLIPGTESISIAPYEMCVVGLSEVKK